MMRLRGFGRVFLFRWLRPRFYFLAASAAFFPFNGFGCIFPIRRFWLRLSLSDFGCTSFPFSGLYHVRSARFLYATNCLSNASTAFTRPSSSLPARRASPISMSGSTGRPTASGTRAMPGPVAVGNSVATPTPARTAA